MRMKGLPTVLSTNPKSLPAREISCVRVALDVPLAKLFEYSLPEEIEARAGDRVAVRFGAQQKIGVVIEDHVAPQLDAARIKPISARRDDAPRLPADWLALMRFLSGYYQRPLGETVISSLPPRLRSTKPLPKEDRSFWRAGPGAPDHASRGTSRRARLLARIEALSPADENALLSADPKTRAAERSALRALAKAGWIEPAKPPRGLQFVPGHPLTAAQSGIVET